MCMDYILLGEDVDVYMKDISDSRLHLLSCGYLNTI